MSRLSSSSVQSLVFGLTFFFGFGSVTAQNSGNVRILRVETAPVSVSQGQTGISVSMVIRNNGVPAVKNLAASLLFISADDESVLNNQYKQRRIDDISGIPARSEVTLLFEVEVKRNASPEQIVLDGQASGTVQGSSVSDVGADETDSWVVQTPAALQVLQVDIPQETVSVGQPSIPASVIIANPSGRSAARANIDGVRFLFLLDGRTDRSGDFEVRADAANPQFVDGGEEAQFGFEIDVLNTAQPEDYVVDVEVLGHDANTGALLGDSNAESPDMIQVQIPARLKVEFTVFDPFQTVGDTFQVQANVKNLGDAGIDDSGELTLRFPGAYALLPTTPAAQPFTADSPVDWRVVAPDVETVSDTFFVDISKTPLERNTGLPAMVEVGTDTAVMQTLDEGTGGEGFIVVDSVRIVEPLGAKDGILSTEQALTVTAFLHRETVRSMSARISLPSAYNFQLPDDFVKSIANDAGDTVQVSWRLLAPRDALEGHYISVDAAGIDSETGGLIDDVAPDTIRAGPAAAPIPLLVIYRANLRLAAEIGSPPSARDGVLKKAQDFMIDARVDNLGQAGVEGETEVALQLPSDFTTSDPMTLTFDANEQNGVSWNIQAPDKTISLAAISLSMTGLPFDENTGQEAAASGTEVVIPVSVQDLICLPTRILSDRVPATVVHGDRNISMFGLEFTNESELEVRLTKIRLLTTDKQGNVLAASSALSRLYVVDYFDRQQVYAEVTSLPREGPVEVTFSTPVSISPSHTVSLDFQVDILSDTEQGSLRLVIPSPADIFVKDEDLNAVLIRDASCVFEPSLSTPSAIVNAAGLKTNFFNYPNPFGSAERPQTRFHYYLKEDSDIAIRIYTMFGELVWARHFDAGAPQGRAGVHDGTDDSSAVIWNGRNGNGYAVLNGVYVAVLTTNGGKATTKIAVAR